jgi:Xaa-Pro aminopeptidase
MEDTISAEEFAARRARVLEALDGAAAVVFAGEGHAPLLGRWRPDRHFLYLTGIENESGAALLFDPSAPDPDRRITLFLRPLNPEADMWDGLRAPLSAALKQQYGIKTVVRTGGLPGALTVAARRTKKLACLHPFAVYPGAVGPDLAAFRQVSERVLGVTIIDKTDLLPSLRSVKSVEELALMRRAVAATVAGYAAARPLIRPGGSEREVADALGDAYRAHGGEHAYNPIVGGGVNAAVLHYMDNRLPLKDGELLLIDSGAAVGGYAADVTRTYPINGRFTPEQRGLYEAVLDAEIAAIEAVKPGVPMWEVDRAARAVLEKAGYPDGYPYGVGHGLGLDVHDALPFDGILQPGMVVTIEPGLYFPDRGIGIRIEDDILVTETGYENLTAAIPKSVADVEVG